MKTINFKLLAIIIISLGFATSCGGDKEKLSPYIGDYVITEAKVAESFNVPVTGFGNVAVPVGTNITTAIQTALLSAVAGCTADKTYIEIREDFTLYMSCELNNPLNAGTWSEVSSTSILLNLNGTVIPASPTGLALPVTEVVITGGVLSGKTSVPLPKAMIAAVLTAINPQMTLDPSAPAVFVVKFSLKFTEK